jgi:hypothetical protein
MTTEVYFDQLCVCGHRRGAHRAGLNAQPIQGDRHNYIEARSTACMVRGCGCTQWRAA